MRRHTTAQQVALRGRIILEAHAGKNNSQIARELDLSVETVRAWRTRWLALQPVALADLPVQDRLSDVPRPGRKSQITAEQTCQLMAHGVRTAQRASHQPVDRTRNCRRSHGARDRQAHLASACGSPVKKGDLQPHLIRYWLTPPRDPERDGKIKAICIVYERRRGEPSKEK